MEVRENTLAMAGRERCQVTIFGIVLGILDETRPARFHLAQNES